MAHTGLPNKEEARFLAVPRLDCLFHQLPCPKIVKEIKVACLPHNLSPKPFTHFTAFFPLFPLSFRLPPHIFCLK